MRPACRACIIAIVHMFRNKASSSGSLALFPNFQHLFSLLPLVCNLDALASIKLQTSSVLLGTDRTRLILVLDEGNPTSTRHKTHFAEALEAAEHAGERLHICVLGKILNEQDLVGREVLVGHNGSRTGPSSLETCTARCFCGAGATALVGSGALETLLFGFKSFLAFCSTLLVEDTCHVKG